MAIELTDTLAEEVFRRYGDRRMDPTDCMCPLAVVLKEHGAPNPGVCRAYYAENQTEAEVLFGRGDEIDGELRKPTPPILKRFIYLVDSTRGYSWSKFTGNDCLALLDEARAYIKGREIA
jgi:hypothetical protein